MDLGECHEEEVSLLIAGEKRVEIMEAGVCQGEEVAQ